MIFAIYVDNLLTCSAERKKINSVKEELKAEFHDWFRTSLILFVDGSNLRSHKSNFFTLGKRPTWKRFFKIMGCGTIKQLQYQYMGPLLQPTAQDYQATDNNTNPLLAHLCVQCFVPGRTLPFQCLLWVDTIGKFAALFCFSLHIAGDSKSSRIHRR